MDNADLEKLKISPGKLAPKFKATVTEYSVTLASSVEDIKFSPLTSDSGASYIIKVCKLVAQRLKQRVVAQKCILKNVDHIYYLGFTLYWIWRYY